MKMTTEHYNRLKSRVATFTHQLPAHLEALRIDQRVKDIETRMLFDIFYGAKIWQVYSPQVFNYTDEHIKTAIKKIVQQLNIKIMDK
jgi:hypothetical protein